MKYLKLYETFKFVIQSLCKDYNINTIRDIVNDRLIELSDIGYYNIDIYTSGLTGDLYIDIYPHPGDWTPDVKLIEFLNIDSEFIESLISLSSELEANGLKLYKFYISSDTKGDGYTVNDIYKIKKGNSYGITLYLKKI